MRDDSKIPFGFNQTKHIIEIIFCMDVTDAKGSSSCVEINQEVLRLILKIKFVISIFWSVWKITIDEFNKYPKYAALYAYLNFIHIEYLL